MLPRSGEQGGVWIAVSWVFASLVHLRDVDGFSVTFGRDIVGEAQANLENGTFLISGTASGSAAEQPTEETSHSFTIQTNC